MGIERWLGVIAGLTAGLAALYYMYGPRIQDRLADDDEVAAQIEAPAPERGPAAAPTPEAPQEPMYPIPEAPMPAAPLPPAAKAPKAKATPPPRQTEPVSEEEIAASDGTVRESVAQVFGEAPVESFLIPDRIIQNIVTTVDSLDREPIPLRFRAVQNVPELPVVEKEGDTLTLSPENGARYRTLIDALEAADTRTMASLYLRYYPLLQQAYREMGYPDAYFNDRVVHIIDHLLATPDVRGPIELVRPKVLYLFADPELEARSSGQKLLIRIGPENAAVVKAKLNEFRAIIAAGKPAPPASG